MFSQGALKLGDFLLSVLEGGVLLGLLFFVGSDDLGDLLLGVGNLFEGILLSHGVMTGVVAILIIWDWLTRSDDILLVNLFLLLDLFSSSTLGSVLSVESLNAWLTIKDGELIVEVSVLWDSERIKVPVNLLTSIGVLSWALKLNGLTSSHVNDGEIPALNNLIESKLEALGLSFSKLSRIFDHLPVFHSGSPVSCDEIVWLAKSSLLLDSLSLLNLDGLHIVLDSLRSMLEVIVWVPEDLLVSSIAVHAAVIWAFLDLLCLGFLGIVQE